MAGNHPARVSPFVFNSEATGGSHWSTENEERKESKARRLSRRIDCMGNYVRNRVVVWADASSLNPASSNASNVGKCTGFFHSCKTMNDFRDRAKWTDSKKCPAD